MFHRLNYHLQVNNILARKQYGFRKGPSTENAAFMLVDSVLKLGITNFVLVESFVI